MTDNEEEGQTLKDGWAIKLGQAMEDAQDLEDGQATDDEYVMKYGKALKNLDRPWQMGRP